MPIKPPTFRPLGWKPARRRPETIDPYYGTQEWKRLRADVLKRDGYRCTWPTCSSPNRGEGGRLVVDHIIERRAGGVDHPSNLRTLCSLCDGRRHASKGGDRGG